MAIPEYKNLSDFMQKTQVATNGLNVVIVMDYVGDKPVRLPGFAMDVDTPALEVYETGYRWWKDLLAELDKDKWPPLNEL